MPPPSLSTTFIPVGAGVYVAACVSNASSTRNPWRGDRREAKRAQYYHPSSVDLWLRALEPVELNVYRPSEVLGENEGRCIFEVTRISVCGPVLPVPQALICLMQGPCPDGH
jgi:hypothetical protein